MDPYIDVVEIARAYGTQGHELGTWPTWFKLGDHYYCWRCMEEKLPRILLALGIGERVEAGGDANERTGE